MAVRSPLRSRSGPGAGFDGDVEFVGDDLGERGFAESRRAVEKNVIEGFAAIASGFEGDGDIFLDAFLADVFGESFGADAGVEARVVVRRVHQRRGVGGDRSGGFLEPKFVICLPVLVLSKRSPAQTKKHP